MNNGLINRGNLLVASLVLSLTVVFSLVAHCSPTTFWIAPNGNDTWPGTRLKPFRTLEWARNVVRKVNGRPGNNGEIVVYLKDGSYRLESPLVLDSSDSGRNGQDVGIRGQGKDKLSGTRFCRADGIQLVQDLSLLVPN